MMNCQRKLAYFSWSWSSLLRCTRRLGWGVLFATVIGGSSVLAWGQAEAAAQTTNLGVFLDGGLQNSQYPSYADNSIGGNAGIFLQPRVLIGAEIRLGTFPLEAKFTQGQVTAGWRVGVMGGLHAWMPYAYAGGGYSRAQDVDGKGKATSALDPCWQTSVGLDRALGSWSVRLFEVSYRKTYTPFRTLRSAEATVGLVRRF
jgi:hypothetical protein